MNYGAHIRIISLVITVAKIILIWFFHLRENNIKNQVYLNETTRNDCQ